MLMLAVLAAFCWAGWEADRLTRKPFAVALTLAIAGTALSSVLTGQERIAQGRNAAELWEPLVFTVNALINLVGYAVFYLIGFALAWRRRRKRREMAAAKTFD